MSTHSSDQLLTIINRLVNPNLVSLLEGFEVAPELGSMTDAFCSYMRKFMNCNKH